MFVIVKIINLLRFALNTITVTLFADYFKNHGLQTTDELPFFAGLILILIPTVILLAIDIGIYLVWESKKDIYLTLIANSHFGFFILIYLLGFIIELNGYILMILMFILLFIAIITNIFQFITTKKPVVANS